MLDNFAWASVTVLLALGSVLMDRSLWGWELLCLHCINVNIQVVKDRGFAGPRTAGSPALSPKDRDAGPALLRQGRMALVEVTYSVCGLACSSVPLPQCPCPQLSPFLSFPNLLSGKKRPALESSEHPQSSQSSLLFPQGSIRLGTEMRKTKSLLAKEYVLSMK